LVSFRGVITPYRRAEAGRSEVRFELPTFGQQCVYMDMEPTDVWFESHLARRMRAELEAVAILTPMPRRGATRVRPFALATAAAVAVGAALLLGTAAVFASGSANPVDWVTQAQRSLGLPIAEKAPAAQRSPEPTPEKEPAAQATAGEHESPEPNQTPTRSEPAEGAETEGGDG
jgi:hypothetical protein